MGQLREFRTDQKSLNKLSNDKLAQLAKNFEGNELLKEALIECYYWRIRPDQSNFTSLLFNLFCKADDLNKIRLAQGFGHEFAAWSMWCAMPSEHDFLRLVRDFILNEEEEYEQ